MESHAKIKNFRQWVFWTGISNIIAYGALLCPITFKEFLNTSNRLGHSLGLGGTVFAMPENVNHVIMINILGLLVVFAGICLIVASFDIYKRTWFIFLEGLLRMIVFLFFFYYVLFSNAAQILLLFGIIDLTIGIIYMYYIFTIKDLKII
ncbi:MAG: hypothetical protein KKE44_23730 [Proteobacteria bacterium]|nr:hypothetical protein [Pseudomonadota bacterium]MBU1585744.1 hypothetical protein [Pseudomonadota bacterium]MBU2628357.1 hypothetical protein [Pseudomonadota bacterium]